MTKTVEIAVVGMNEVLDEGLPLHPLQEQKDSVKDWRQIGLGVFGIADMCIKLGIRYGSEESIELFDKIGFTIANAAVLSSSMLASKNGRSYPNFDYYAVSKSQWFIDNTTDYTKEFVKRYGLYNSQLLTCAPTGTLSTMIRVSGGIEPIFANYYTRKTESLHGHDEYYKVYTPIVKEYMDEHNLSDDSELPDYFVTAQTLDSIERINVQSVWQSHIDASISSTINLPQSATVEDVENIYRLAWKKGLKGVTIYRDKCKRSGILTMDNDNEEKESPKELKRGMIIIADDNCIGRKRTLHTGCGTLHCEAFFDPLTGKLLETYLSKGSTGGCNSFMVGLSRMISLAARGGIDIYSIIDQLKSCPTCPSYAVRAAVKKDTSIGNCCPVAIGNALLDMYKEIQDSEILLDDADNDEETTTGIKCPECGGDLVFEGGCNTCKNCGYSKCD